MSPRERPAILIVSYGRPDLLARCLESLVRHVPTWPVHVWDNRSPQSDEIRMLASAGTHAAWHFCDGNLGFAAAVNRLAREIGGDFLLFNPDAVATAGFEPLEVALSRDPRLAAVGPLLEVRGLQPWDNARRLPGLPRMLGEHLGFGNRLRGTRLGQRYDSPPQYPGYVSGACLLVRRQAWLDVGEFDEQYWLYTEELDWSRRATDLGWRIGLHPKVLAAHVGGASLGGTVDQQARRRQLLLQTQIAYLAKHHGRLAAATYERAARLWTRFRALRRRVRERRP